MTPQEIAKINEVKSKTETKEFIEEIKNISKYFNADIIGELE